MSTLNDFAIRYMAAWCSQKPELFWRASRRLTLTECYSKQLFAQSIQRLPATECVSM